MILKPRALLINFLRFPLKIWNILEIEFMKEIKF